MNNPSNIDELIAQALADEKTMARLINLGLLPSTPSSILSIDDDELYTVKEIAGYLKLGVRSIQQMCSDGVINSMQVGGANRTHRIPGSEFKRVVLKSLHKPSMLQRLAKLLATEKPLT